MFLAINSILGKVVMLIKLGGRILFINLLKGLYYGAYS
jgi:hypothetical protein